MEISRSDMKQLLQPVGYREEKMAKARHRYEGTQIPLKAGLDSLTGCPFLLQMVSAMVEVSSKTGPLDRHR